MRKKIQKIRDQRLGDFGRKGLMGIGFREEMRKGFLELAKVADIRDLRVSNEYLEREIAEQEREIERRSRAYRAGRPSVELAGRAALVIDDGVPSNHAIDDLCVEVWQREPVLRIVRGKCLLARQHRL